MSSGELVTLELWLPIPLAEADARLGPWLWSVAWPVELGDLRATPRSLRGGLPPTPVLLAFAKDESMSANGTRGEPPGLELFRDPDRDVFGGSWVISVCASRPGTLTLEARDEGCLLRLAIHPALAAESSYRHHLGMELGLLPLAIPGLRAHIPRALAPEVEAVDLALSAQMICTEAGFCEGFHIQASGVAASARAHARAHWQGMLLGPALSAVKQGAYAQDGPARRSLEARLTRWAVAQRGPGHTGRPPLGLVDESATYWPPRGQTRPEREVGRELRHGVMCSRSGRSVSRSGTLSELVAWLLSELRAGRCSVGAIGLPERSPFSWPHALTALRDLHPTVALYLGPEHLGSLVHERLLTHGPWKVERSPEGGALVVLHHPRAPESAAQQQLGVALPALRGLLLPADPRLPPELAEYDADTRTVLVRPAGGVELGEGLAQVLGFARAHASDPRCTVERVLAPIADPVLARLWLPHLWLRGIQVWTVQDGSWVRIDEGYAPGWEPPAWTRWDEGADAAL